MPITVNTNKTQPPVAASAKEEENATEKKPPGAKWLSWLIELSIIAAALLLAFLVRSTIYDVALITSRSMQPTLNVGDRLVFDHRKSLDGQWQRGDILFFDPPESWQTDDPSVFVKRLIALPGETIEMRRGQILVNNQQIQGTTAANPEDSILPFQLGKDQYFVMGDNRQNSADSRVHGPIGRKDIRGRAVWRLWPAPGRLPSAF